jgi:hypothetical protein
MKLTPPADAPLSFLGSYIAYPIGKILLRVLTFGSYPPELRKHNYFFVALFPWFAIIAGFLIVDEWSAIESLMSGN